MLRLVVLVLLLANAAFFAWSQGLLAVWGLGPAQQSEPQRMAQQIRPEAVRVLSSDDVRRIEASAAGAPKAPECVQAGLFTEAEADRIRQALDGWPASAWSIEAATEPARWIVYMGKYPSADAVGKKKAELRQLGVSFEALSNASLEPGLSLGGYPTEAAAKQQLEALSTKGVRTARVVQERAETKGQLLKFPAVDDAIRPRLDELKPALAGKPLRTCR